MCIDDTGLDRESCLVVWSDVSPRGVQSKKKASLGPRGGPLEGPHPEFSQWLRRVGAIILTELLPSRQWFYGNLGVAKTVLMSRQFPRMCWLMLVDAVCLHSGKLKIG